MSIEAAETPTSDHVARFWRYLRTETVRILLDLKRTVGTDAPDGPIVYWDGATFSDDVAKAMLKEQDRLIDALRPMASLPVGPELMIDADGLDTVLYKNGGNSITARDVMNAREAITAAGHTA